jgi:1,4-dihydroxy-2-naphthoyl-CoA hydrolase
MKFDLESCQQALKNTLPEALGVKMTEVEKGRIVATMPVNAQTRQPLGLLHGGASVALAETLASMGGWMLVAESGKVVVGQEINANHLRPIKEGLVTGKGVVIHQGKTSQVWEVKIYDEREKLICVSRCTLAVIDPRL